MHPRHVLAGPLGGLHLGDDLIEGEGRRVHHPGALGGLGDHRLGHQGAGVEHHRATADQVAPAHRDQVRRPRPGTDEVDGHDPVSARRDGNFEA